MQIKLNQMKDHIINWKDGTSTFWDEKTNRVVTKKRIKVLELFAGSRSIGKVCNELNYQVFSSDINDFGGIDYVVDILNFDVNKIPFVPDILFSSPPCTTYSVASIGRHWVKGQVFTPKTDSARLGIELLDATLKLIDYYLKLNPNLVWYIENPRGKMRKSPKLQPTDNTLFEVKNPIIRHTVTYCQYEMDKEPNDRRMKPTDIFTNNPNLKPKPMCKNGDSCHASAPRGSRTGGTQGLKNNYERSKIPSQLCYELLTSL